MSETPPSDKPAISALLSDLAIDAKGFAQAEAAYLRAQLAERTAYAKPALPMIGIGAGIIIGIAIAFPIGVMLVLWPLIGALAALGLVTIAGGVIGALLLMAGTRRIKAAIKPPERR
jgi:Putative Actinobacterial Holin-X, holin superfamily III